MILKYLLRSIAKRPFLNLIKIIGLSLALSCILLIILFLHFELSFDNFHKNSDRIYRLTTTQSNTFYDKHFARIPNPGFVPDMAEYFPEIENYVRLVPIRGGVIKLNEKYLDLEQAFECDSTFFEVFDTELLRGNSADILNEPGSLIISESYSKQLFGDIDPIGKPLSIPAGQFYGNDSDFTINGIMKDFPQNSHFHPDFIVSPVDKTIFNSWAWTYLLIRENSDPEKIVSGFSNFTKSLLGDEAGEIEWIAHMQKITNIHLHSKKLREIEPNSSMTVIYTLSGAVLILLLIAFINYANLNLGMAGNYRKYFRISSISGASTWMRFIHYLAEGIIIALAVIILTTILALLASSFIQRNFDFDLFTGKSILVFITAILFSIFGIISGAFPLLKKNTRIGNSKGLIVIQFTFSIALIIAVLVISRQTNFALNRSMGIENNNIICLENVHTNVQSEFEIFKEELLNNSSIEFVSGILDPPGGEANDMFQFEMEGYVPDTDENENNFIGILPCDYSFANVFDLNFLAGENFTNTNFDLEGAGEYIINESAMRRLNYTEPTDIVGKEFNLVFGNGEIIIPKGKIIGVVDDFHLSTVKKEIEPLVMFKRKDMWLPNFVVSFRPGTHEESLNKIENVWSELFPEYPFKYRYVSSMYEELYRSELLQAKLLSIFSFIALFICSMGLLGMALLKTQSRTKEIGIRKVNGASAGQILGMLTWDFIQWILLSFFVSIPIAIFAMNKWLENFAYKTTLTWWIFALAGLAAIIIAMITISGQSWKAANQNPVKSLKHE